MRDARWRRNAWCVVTLLLVLMAGVEHPLVLREVLPLVAAAGLAHEEHRNGIRR